ncbi:MAG: carboxypeptidase-like regulatory domain-containing protein, partial [Bacteroidales bacterium]|nr:carboxypeptidase-like regulatory domain-containing protein [Bacteroidales bacterium]
MKNLFIKIAFLMLASGIAVGAGAQTVKGVVKDANGEALPGVSVMIQGTTVGVSTGLDGDYSINVPDAKTQSLLFSCIGMKDEVVPVNGRSVIDMVMVEDNNFLEETVVIGYATVKRRDLMGSVSSVDNKALTAVPVTSVTEALTGRMAGVQVTTTEGDPDADIKIRVRGAGSITQDSSPLYIVDG